MAIFLRRFIPNFAEILKLNTNMLKKESKIKMTVESRQSFENIKKALLEGHILVNPDFSKDFMVFYFSSEHPIVGVLL